MKFLVVSPPFVIAVDSFGQPDPRHAMLDIPASFVGTRLEGTEAQILDAAVVADKLVLATPAWLLMCDPSGPGNDRSQHKTLLWAVVPCMNRGHPTFKWVYYHARGSM